MLGAILTCGLVLGIAACQFNQSAKFTMTKQMTNIVDNNGADPWVSYEKGRYYYTKTTGDSVTLWRSKQLETVFTGKQKTIFKIPDELESIWAPEIHYLDGRWVVYFAANKANETHRMYALTNPSKDPYKGNWQLTPIKGMDDKFAIDGTILTVKDKNYFIWSGWQGYENVAQNIYISPMISPTEVENKKIELSHPEYEWEMRQKPFINEGPQVTIKNDTIHLIYSASGSWDNDYCLGELTAKVEADLLNPASWSKAKAPILKSNAEVYGPGHHSIVSTKDGKQDWIIYHTARWDHSGWHRLVRMNQVKWQGNKIKLSSPTVDNELISRPSSQELSRFTLAATQAEKTKGLSVINDDYALNHQVITGFENPNDQLTFHFQAPKTAEYTVMAYVKMENYDDPENILEAKFSVKQEEKIAKIYPSQYYQPVQIKIKLNQGKQTIHFQSVIGVDTLSVDRIEIIENQGE
ncbi:hypothetical protein RR47_GL000266 [Enterococcus columbae DSM 7374 = ATCC 51263]|nr:hypothetical protein RR47_GL000266 [Enterococcus columbae DSM 7374 = ATCC 51263]